MFMLIVWWYADDTVLIAPSYTAMQKLIDCCNFAVDNNIIIYLYVLSSFTCILLIFIYGM